MTKTADEKWQDEVEVELEKGEALVKKASEDSLNYITDVIEKLGDKAWRKMAVMQHGIEIGAGFAVAEVAVNRIYNTMRKHFNKKIKLNKQDSDMLARIYMGRLIQNVVKELNNEADKKG